MESPEQLGTLAFIPICIINYSKEADFFSRNAKITAQIESAVRTRCCVRVVKLKMNDGEKELTHI